MPRKPNAKTVRSEIKKVIALEARALERLGRSVDGAYERAVSLLCRCRGKVVVMGVGKSGLIAQKIAATLTSTGTPAVYLDASDARHGSLGLVQRQDVIIALGKSGESDEMRDLFPRLRRIGAKLIAVTAEPDSTLARHAALVLETPIEREACPLNLTPTCSTTAALAVGDALAVALMKLRDFGVDQFADNHPGGRLGKRLTLRVADIMRAGRNNPVIRENAGISRMLVEITRQHAGAVSVVDGGGRLKGLVTDCDIRRALESGKDPRELSIRDIMNPRPATIGPDALASRAVKVMGLRNNPFNVLPVVDRRGRAVGMIQIHDLRARGL
ncbi:MAG: KpsF/GutQ family sugar-phosphate isomerase [Elusimicrobia bacterium]|nr:KpsF/GutQ family sugar-phosphate isomerase [Elusimicrobiota bacterium]